MTNRNTTDQYNRYHRKPGTTRTFCHVRRGAGTCDCFLVRLVVLRKMSREFLRAIGVTIVGLSVICGAGCTSPSSGSSTPKVPGLEKTDLTVGAVPVADEAGLYIAQDEGLFAAEGSLMQPGNQALYTLPGSRIAEEADLKGARIGVNVPNNIGTLLISVMLREYGVSPGQVHFVQMPFPAMGQALQRHAIDAAWLPEPFGSADAASMGLAELCDLDQGATQGFPVGWYVTTKAWAKKYPRTLAAFLDALRQGQQIADTQRTAVEQAMEKLPSPYTVPPVIASVMSLESYPLNVAPDIDRSRVQRVANEMYQFQMLSQPFRVSSMLGGL